MVFRFLFFYLTATKLSIKLGTTRKTIMSKKHFISLGNWIREHNKISVTPGTSRTPFNMEHLETLSEFMRESNPRFNKERWIGFVLGHNGPNGGVIK